MTSKEYRDTWQGESSFSWFDVLNPHEIKDLRRDVRERVTSGAEILPGTNNKATVRPAEGGYILTSYYTDVARIYKGHLVRLWDGWSATTSKHVSAFCDKFGIARPSKREWCGMPVNDYGVIATIGAEESATVVATA